MVSDVVTLQSGDKAQDAAQAFERYDLVSHRSWTSRANSSVG